MNHKASPTLLLLAALSLTTPSCVVPPVGVYGGVYSPPVEYGYEPLLYNGYVVYYTDVGQPYYWLGGARVWVPSYARPRYVEHWQRYRHAYPVWYKHRGDYYKTHRFTGPGDKPVRAGPGTYRWNPPGPERGLGASPGRPYDAPRYQTRPGNPPGPAGGRRENWDHRRGPAGGQGMSRDGAPRGNPNRDGTPPGRSGTGRYPPAGTSRNGQRPQQSPYSSPGEQPNSWQGIQHDPAPETPRYRHDTGTWEGVPQIGGSPD